MRVIAGRHRSRLLAEFKGREVRPTSDRAKEALFNILQTRIAGCDFLDLFCGTGSIGIEALSRGANSVVFVDSSKESVAITQKNLSALKENGKVVLSDAENFLRTSDMRFDVVFLDPPYAYDASAVIALAAEKRLLKDGGVIVYEHSADAEAKNFELLRLYDTRKYGAAAFDFYVYEGDNI